MSAPSLNDFIATTKLGLARSNRYTVSIATPKSIKDEIQSTGVNLQTVHLFCDQVQLPGLNVNTSQIKTFGEIREMPYEFNYDPIQMNFYVDKNMVVKSFFDKWIQSIQNGLSRTFNYYDEYIAPAITINVQDLNDDRRYTVSIYEAYPKTISAVQMGYDQKDVMKLSVTMNYKYWLATNIPDSETVDTKPKDLTYTINRDQRDSAYGNYKPSNSNYSPMDQMLLQLEKDNIAFTAEIAQTYTGITVSPSKLVNDYFEPRTLTGSSNF